MIESKTYTTTEIPVTLPDGNGGLKSYPNLLTEDELIRFLRIPEISHRYCLPPFGFPAQTGRPLPQRPTLANPGYFESPHLSAHTALAGTEAKLHWHIKKIALSAHTALLCGTCGQRLLSLADFGKVHLRLLDNPADHSRRRLHSLYSNPRRYVGTQLPPRQKLLALAPKTSPAPA